MVTNGKDFGGTTVSEDFGGTTVSHQRKNNSKHCIDCKGTL